MWDLTGPGLEPVSPALAGGFLTTAPPGKPLTLPSPAAGGTLKRALHACSGERPGPSPCTTGPLALPLRLTESWIPGRGPWL